MRRGVTEISPRRWESAMVPAMRIVSTQAQIPVRNENTTPKGCTLEGPGADSGPGAPVFTAAGFRPLPRRRGPGALFLF